MFKDDVELIESVLSKLDKERHHVMGVPIYRWFNFEINKRSELKLFIIYKIEDLECVERSIFIDCNHISVSYIKRVLDEDMQYIKNLVVGKITESEW